MISSEGEQGSVVIKFTLNYHWNCLVKLSFSMIAINMAINHYPPMEVSSWENHLFLWAILYKVSETNGIRIIHYIPTC